MMGRKIGKQIRAICEYVESNPGCKTTDIAVALPGKTPQTGLTRLCRRAEGHGLLKMTGKRPMRLEMLPNWRILIDRGEVLVNKRVAVVTVTGPVSVFDLGRV